MPPEYKKLYFVKKGSRPVEYGYSNDNEFAQAIGWADKNGYTEVSETVFNLVIAIRKDGINEIQKTIGQAMQFV